MKTDRCSPWLLHSKHSLCLRPSTLLKKDSGNKKNICEIHIPDFLFSVTKWVSGEERKVEGRQGGGDTAVAQGTIGALWHQPLDSPSCSPKALNSPTMYCCSGKGGFREFNFQHNWPYSTPLNAKEMVCSVCLCEELCLQRVSSSRRDREKRRKWRDGKDRQGGETEIVRIEKEERIRLNDWER